MSRDRLTKASMLALLSILAYLTMISLVNPEHKVETVEKWADGWMQARDMMNHDSTIQSDFAREYPILTDWLRQDTDEHWSKALSTNREQDRQRVENVLEDLAEIEVDVSLLNGRLNAIVFGEEQNESDLLNLYLEACELRREARLATFLALNSPVVFAQHHNFMMSFIGYTEGLSDARHERFFKPGSRLVQLDFHGLYGRPHSLIEDRHGLLRDVDVSPDGSKLVFAWKKSDRLDDYHIYKYELSTSKIEQLTHGIGRADYEPVYLPDGDIIFTSTRPEQSVPCWWTEISNLYRMNERGQYLRRLAIDQVHTLYPQVMDNGRVIYTRWDYSDRGQNYPHPLFSMNPDGTDQRVFYGGNSWFPTSLLHARGIPGSHKVMAIAAGHHTRQHGKIVILDVTEGRDEGKGMHFIAPKREVLYERVDRAQQTGDQFRYPYPISEEEFLVSFLPEEPGEKYPEYPDKAVYGLYWMDVDGHRELLYYDPELPIGRPALVRRVSSPPIIPDTVDYHQKTGVYYVHDVYEGIGLKNISRGTAKKIRVVRLNYRAAGVGMTLNEGEGGRSLNSSPVAIGNGSWDIKEILGDVDIEEDGSALFEVPAMQSLYLQVLDKQGRVIQNTRSWDTVRPGEKKACRGCHAKEDANFYPYEKENTLAWNHKPQQLQPFYGGVKGFSYIQEIQPILDQKCVQCHDGSRKNVMDLTGTMKSHGTIEKRRWSRSYLNLTHSARMQRKDDHYYAGDPENPVVNWISKMSKPTELEPYSFGAATSQLMHLLEEGHYGVQLTKEEFHKFYAWLDLLVPFIGEYREANNWSDEEMAYYDYYEHKRSIHKEEELEAIRAWLKKQGKQERPAVNSTKTAEMNGYRLLMTIPVDKEETCKFQDEVMVDRVDVKFVNHQQNHIKVQITFQDGSKIEKKCANGESIILDAPHPTRSIRFDLGGHDIIEASIWGIEMNMLPNHGSHHPYLQLGGE